MTVPRGTVVDGALKATTVNSSGIPIDMEAKTKFLMPENYTTLTLVKMFGKTIEAKDMVHKYREDRPIPHWTSISAADAAGQTNIEVQDPSYIQDDQVLWVIRDGVVVMQLLVQDTSIDATVDVVVFTGTTGSGALTAATVVGDIVLIGPEAHAEGEAVPAAFTNITTDREDYLMQTDRAVKKTDIEGNIGHYDDFEKKLGSALKKAWVEEKAKLNLVTYVATKTKESTSASANRYLFDGLFNRLTENSENYGGVGSGFTVQALTETIRSCRDESASGGKLVLVAGVNTNAHISGWADGAVRVTPSDKTWGIQINTIQTQYGPIGVVYDNVLNETHGLSDRFVVLNSAHMRKMHLPGLPLRAYYDITTARDIHNMEHAISGTIGTQVSSVESHAQGKGVN